MAAVACPRHVRENPCACRRTSSSKRPSASETASRISDTQAQFAEASSSRYHLLLVFGRHKREKPCHFTNDALSSRHVWRKRALLPAPRRMLINLLPDFFALLDSSDPVAAYYRYFDTHRRVLEAYWLNYVLEPVGQHFEEIIR